MSELLSKAILAERARTAPADVIGINIRFPVEVHETLQKMAQRESISLNGLVISVIREVLRIEAERMASEMARSRGGRIFNKDDKRLPDGEDGD